VRNLLNFKVLRFFAALRMTEKEKSPSSPFDKGGSKKKKVPPL